MHPTLQLPDQVYFDKTSLPHKRFTQGENHLGLIDAPYGMMRAKS
ncbi:MAG: hypothetical protein ACI9TH_000878 [Kiritimatiellia bacterium]|jgi:hypothetical protein